MTPSDGTSLDAPWLEAGTAPPRSAEQWRADGGAMLVIALDREGAELALSHAACCGADRAVTVVAPVRLSMWWVLARAGGAPVHPLDLTLESEAIIRALAERHGLRLIATLCPTEGLRGCVLRALQSRDYGSVVIGCRRISRRARTLARTAGTRCPVEVVTFSCSKG